MNANEKLQYLFTTAKILDMQLSLVANGLYNFIVEDILFRLIITKEKNWIGKIYNYKNETELFYNKLETEDEKITFLNHLEKAMIRG